MSPQAYEEGHHGSKREGIPFLLISETHKHTSASRPSLSPILASKSGLPPEGKGAVTATKHNLRRVFCI